MQRIESNLRINKSKRNKSRSENRSGEKNRI